MIKLLETDGQLLECTKIIRESFQTVADEFHLTPENAPTNPAFIRFEDVKVFISKGVVLHGLYQDLKMIGCIAIEKSKDNNCTYYIERLAVLPSYRHKGYGKRLMDFASNKIVEIGGKEISIGIIDENSKLKKWYFDYGFMETGKKAFSHLPFTVCFMKKVLVSK